MISRGVEACVNVIHRRCQVTRECPKRLAVENFQVSLDVFILLMRLRKGDRDAQFSMTTK